MPLATLSRPRQKTPRLRRIERTLDTLERRFVRAVRRLLADRVRELEPVVEQVLATGRMDNLTLPEPGAYERLLVAFVVETYGAGMGHGLAEVDDLRKRQTRRARLAGSDGEPVVPEGAVGFVRGRRDLARFFEKDQAETVRRVLAEGLEQGQSLKQVMKSLEEALPGQMGRARLENIARTEATTAYNQGRLAMFLDSDGFIAGVEFMAILDARTTDICQHRDGLVFRLDDPAIRQNTPPLHYQCRSILSPVPVMALKDSDLERTRQRMEDAPEPQVTKRGRFGNEPWPDVQGGGGAAPMPRAKPVGPKVGGAEQRGPVERHPRVGGRFLGKPVSGHSIEVAEEDVESAWLAYGNDKYLNRLFPNIDSSDVRDVGRYLMSTGNDELWDDVIRGGHVGKSLLIHELVEMDYLQKANLNPFIAVEQAQGYLQAHAKALVAEHQYLLDIARSRGYHEIESILPLVQVNPSVPQECRDNDSEMVERAFPRLRSSARERAMSYRFYLELLEEEASGAI